MMRSIPLTGGAPAHRGRSVLALMTVLSLVAVSFVAGPAATATAEVDVCDGAPTDVFGDVRPGSTHAAAIDCLAAYGITQGVGGNNYAPTAAVPRDQMASFLINFLQVATDGQLPAPTTSARFTDVTGATHAANIVRAAELGIAQGRTPERFDPRTPVTRAQMASFVARTVEVAGHRWATTVPDAFRDDDGSTHERNIDRLAHVRIVRGVDGMNFLPQRPVSRAQMASFLVAAAQHLADQGRWSASLVVAEEPTIELVTRPDADLDRIEVRWDREVQVADSSRDVRIVDATGVTVATATSLTADGAVLALVLDALLVDGEVYWIELPAGLVADVDGTGNLEVARAFSFTTAAGGSGEDGDGTDGEETDGEESDPADGTDGDDAAGGESAEPSITAVVTDPGADRILVSFDAAVTCPTSPAARDAWWFSNASVIESGISQASGAPDAVAAVAGDPTTCALRYTAEGIEDGDFGMLSYTRPDADADRVVTSDGGFLPTTNDVRVRDGKAPSFDAVDGFASSEVIRLTFSEPVACSTLAVSQFLVSVDEVSIGIQEAHCQAPADATPLLELARPLSANEQLEVTLVSGSTLSDESLDNQVPGRARTALIS